MASWPIFLLISDIQPEREESGNTIDEGYTTRLGVAHPPRHAEYTQLRVTASRHGTIESRITYRNISIYYGDELEYRSHFGNYEGFAGTSCCHETWAEEWTDRKCQLGSTSLDPKRIGSSSPQIDFHRPAAMHDQDITQANKAIRRRIT